MKGINWNTKLKIKLVQVVIKAPQIGAVTTCIPKLEKSTIFSVLSMNTRQFGKYELLLNSRNFALYEHSLVDGFLFYWGFCGFAFLKNICEFVRCL